MIGCLAAQQVGRLPTRSAFHEDLVLPELEGPPIHPSMAVSSTRPGVGCRHQPSTGSSATYAHEMSLNSIPSAGLVPVHVGQPVPDSEEERLLLRSWNSARARLAFQRDRLRVPHGVDWESHGFCPRWFGQESSDCIVALQPGRYHRLGAEETERFLAGARSRDEVAIVVASIGDAESETVRNVFADHDSTVDLSAQYSYIGGRRLPTGTIPRLAQDLSAPERDLALRLLNRPGDAPWWAMELRGMTTTRGDGLGGETHHQPEGELRALLVDGLGDPVVAVWVSSTGDQRWYVVPDATSWDTILDWLIKSLLPELVPTALRRVRSAHFTDPGLQTKDELAAQAALEAMERRQAAEKEQLEEALSAARDSAAEARNGLLYSTGKELVRAVAAVLNEAGLDVVDLDAELGTRSADLLVTDGRGPGRLVEVKAESGAAKENLVSDLERHLNTWPQLRPNEAIEGGVLIVNHQHRRHPAERTPQVYSRAEFVAALRVPVLSTWQLYQWWASGELDSIRKAVIGDGIGEQPPASMGGAAKPVQEAIGAPTPPSQKWRWRLRNRN